MQITGEAGPIFAALAKSQAEFSAVTRDRQNDQLRNRYATLNAIREMTRPILGANGVALLVWHTVVTDAVPTEVTDKGGSYSAASGSVLTHLMAVHTSGATVTVDPVAIPWLHTRGINRAQAVGVAMTYGARYAETSFCGIAATDVEDTDAEPVRTAPTPRVVAVPAMDAPDADAIRQVQALWAGCQSKAAAVEVGMALSKQGRAADHPVSVASKAARESALARLNHG